MPACDPSTQEGEARGRKVVSASVNGWFLKIKTFFKFIFIYFCVSVHTHVCVEVIGQLVEVSSFLPLCGFGESNSVRKPWQ